MVKNLAKPGNFSREVKANLTMEEVEASEVEDFASVNSAIFQSFQSVDRFPVITTGNVDVK